MEENLARIKPKEQKESKERQDFRSGISAKDQLARLDSKLGKDVGAKKEREKLKKLMEGKKVKEKDTEVEENEEKKPKKKKKK